MCTSRCKLCTRIVESGGAITTLEYFSRSSCSRCVVAFDDFSFVVDCLSDWVRFRNASFHFVRIDDWPPLLAAGVTGANVIPAADDCFWFNRSSWRKQDIKMTNFSQAFYDVSREAIAQSKKCRLIRRLCLSLTSPVSAYEYFLEEALYKCSFWMNECQGLGVCSP